MLGGGQRGDPFDRLRVVEQLNHMHELGADGTDRQSRGNEVLAELLQTELGEGGGTAEDQHGSEKRMRHTFQTTPGRSSGLAAGRIEPG